MENRPGAAERPDARAGVGTRGGGGASSRGAGWHQALPRCGRISFAACGLPHGCLKSLYVRILEDRGIPSAAPNLDAEDELFRHLAPNLGPSAYLRWEFRDPASLRGGLPSSSRRSPAELSPVPQDAYQQRLIDFWRSKNLDTEARFSTWGFDDEHFDSRLMGDLYQDLDPAREEALRLAADVPDFVLDFILDETLTPAIAEWGAGGGSST